MPFTTGPGLRIAYEEMGRAGGPAVVVISGLGRQLVDTEPELCETLAAGGLRVIRFDNRDVGLSDHLEGKVDLGKVRRSLDAGLTPEVPYLLSDMARDTARLLDHLELPRAHLVGISMGGAIAQTAAVEHPDRVITLTSIMSATGAGDVGQPDERGRRALFTTPPPDPAQAVETLVEARRLIASPRHFDPAGERARVTVAVNRAFDPAGTGRQLAAIWASGDRTADLRAVSVPTLVIHGTEDGLVDPSGGRATAAAIPGATFLEIRGMGHDIPAPFRAQIADAIIAHVHGAERAAPGRDRRAPEGN